MVTVWYEQAVHMMLKIKPYLHGSDFIMTREEESSSWYRHLPAYRALAHELVDGLVSFPDF